MEKNKGMVGKEEGVSACDSRHDRAGGGRSTNWLVVVGSAAATCLVVAGCTSLKKAALVSGVSVGAGALASIATGGTAPALLAASGAEGVTSVVADLSSSPGGQAMTDCAPDNFWSMLGSLIEMGGWALILIFLLPIVIGWILPGPTKLNKK